jgi:predicted P-loop ATPase
MKYLSKLTFSLVVATALFFSGKVNAQTTNDETQLIQGMWGMEKRDIIDHYMKLSAEDSKKFWPIYDQYETERKKLGAERLQILREYAAAYEKLTPEQADNLVNRIFVSESNYQKMEKAYYTKIKTAIGAMPAANFLQLEEYLRTAIRFSIQDNIPFVGDLERQKKEQ